MKIKFDSAKLLSVAVTVIGVAGTLLSSKVESNARKTMKDELRKEILDEISKSK